MAVPFSPILERANGDGQGPQVGVRTEDRNPLPDFALSRANAPGSLLRRSTKLVTAGEGLHPLWRRRTSSSSKAKLVSAVATN